MSRNIDSDDIPNPFQRRQFAFRVLSEEKDPMSRAKHYTHIMPTLSSRLQQLISTRLWEYTMLILSLWSFVPLIVRTDLLNLQISFELTNEVTQAALFIEVSAKLYADWRWFSYDLWNFYDLICVILNSPFIYNLFLSDHLGVPEIDSIQRLFRTLHVIRLIRIHTLLRFVFETIFIAVSSIYHTLLLEFIVTTVLALLSIALEGDTPHTKHQEYEPYENYTEALYSYYMCITLEGVNEVAEQVLELENPQFTTYIGLAFYIFAAIVTYSVGQLLSAMVATTLDKAINKITLNQNIETIKLIGLKRITNNERPSCQSRCFYQDEYKNFSRLKADDLSLLIILYQIFEKNLQEFQNILHDLHQIGDHIAKLNEKNFVFNLIHNEQLFVEYQRLKIMMNTLNKIFHDLTSDDEELTTFEEFHLNETEQSPTYQHDLHLLFQSIEKKIFQIENKFKRTPILNEQNQVHRHLFERFKEKFYKNKFSN